jgi:hypothetical protein
VRCGAWRGVAWEAYREVKRCSQQMGQLVLSTSSTHRWLFCNEMAKHALHLLQ